MAKKRKHLGGGMVYSTNKDLDFNKDLQEEDTLIPKEQKLYVSLDKKQRKGKAVTLIEGFVGAEDDLQELGKKLKAKCGVGGSAKDGEILVQGDQRDKVQAMLVELGFNVKRKGG
jgi:translation initiation factor 1